LPIAKRLDVTALDERPVSALLADAVGVPITRLDWEMEIIPAPRDVGAVLGITPGILIASSTYSQHLETGWPIEAGVVSYRLDRVRFRFSSGDARWLVPPGRAPWASDPSSSASPHRSDEDAPAPHRRRSARGVRRR
jgi:hypothetical protein